MAVVATAEEVHRVKPDMGKVAALNTRGLIVTGPGGGAFADCDFVSEFFRATSRDPRKILSPARPHPGAVLVRAGQA